MWFKNPVPSKDWMATLAGPLSPWETESLELDVTLRERLLGLTLLDGVPLGYLVPDPRLLPPESIRFFFLEPNWIERLLEGALAAANVGSMDDQTAAALMEKVRADEVLRRRFTQPTTGFVLRSALVSRYPGMQVRACGEDQGKVVSDETTLALPLRRRTIGDSILLVLFDGVIQWVALDEPSEGTHFTIERDEEKSSWTQDVVPLSGTNAPGKANISFRGEPSSGVLDVAALADAIATKLNTREVDSRHVAATLQNRPFRMVFRANGPFTIPFTINDPGLRIATPR